MKQIHETKALDFKCITDVNGKIVAYELREPVYYFSNRYHKIITLPKGMISDGASGPAEDVVSLSWWVHDRLYDKGKWDDSTPCSKYQANLVLHDILQDEGRWVRKYTWLIATTVWAVLCDVFES